MMTFQAKTYVNALLLDIDGTLTGTKSGKPFKQSPDDILPLSGAQKAVSYFANRGFKIYGITNQGGCSTLNPATNKPYKTIKDTVSEMQNTLVLFPEIESIYFCPSMNGGNCLMVKRGLSATIMNDFWEGLYRKPDIGMINEVQYLYNEGDYTINKQESLLVGDREEDKQCASNTGIPFMDAATWRFKYGSFVN